MCALLTKKSRARLGSRSFRRRYQTAAVWERTGGVSSTRHTPVAAMNPSHFFGHPAGFSGWNQAPPRNNAAPQGRSRRLFSGLQRGDRSSSGGSCNVSCSWFEPRHAAHQIGRRRFEQQVVAIAHQHIPLQSPPSLATRLGKRGEKTLAITIVGKDRPRRSPRHIT